MSESDIIIDKRAETKWGKSAISFENFKNYVGKKEDKFHLTLIDLLYISNFKGGNATINEPSDIIEKKLQSYSDIFIKIDEIFGAKNLSNINEKEVEVLYGLIEEIYFLTDKNSDKKIDGFSISYLSALLHGYFINLIPILDRRILINLKLVKANNIDKQGQIKKIFSFYKDLIVEMRRISISSKKDIRDIDKEYFPIYISKN